MGLISRVSSRTYSFRDNMEEPSIKSQLIKIYNSNPIHRELQDTEKTYSKKLVHIDKFVKEVIFAEFNKLKSRRPDVYNDYYADIFQLFISVKPILNIHSTIGRFL